LLPIILQATVFRTAPCCCWPY